MLGAVALRWVVLPVTAQQSPEEADVLRAGIDRGAARVGLAAAAALLVAALARLWAQSASLFGVPGALDPGRLAQALEGVGGGARLIGAAAQESRACFSYRNCSAQHLLLRLH
jgi:hypothetical protein